MIHRVRKCRVRRSASADMAYVAVSLMLHEQESLWTSQRLLLVDNAGELRSCPRENMKENTASWHRTVDDLNCEL